MDDRRKTLYRCIIPLLSVLRRVTNTRKLMDIVSTRSELKAPRAECPPEPLRNLIYVAAKFLRIYLSTRQQESGSVTGDISQEARTPHLVV